MQKRNTSDQKGKDDMQRAVMIIVVVMVVKVVKVALAKVVKIVLMNALET